MRFESIVATASSPHASESGSDAAIVEDICRHRIVLLWGSLDIQNENLGSIEPRMHCRLHSNKKGLSFAILVSKDKYTFPEHFIPFARDGDLLLTTNSLYFWRHDGWKTGQLSGKTSKHPFLSGRRLSLHPSGFIVSWLKTTISPSLRHLWSLDYHCAIARQYFSHAYDKFEEHQEKVKPIFSTPLKQITTEMAVPLLQLTLNMVYDKDIQGRHTPGETQFSSPNLADIRDGVPRSKQIISERSPICHTEPASLLSIAPRDRNARQLHDRSFDMSQSPPESANLPSAAYPDTSSSKYQHTLLLSFDQQIYSEARRNQSTVVEIMTYLYNDWCHTSHSPNNRCIAAEWETETGAYDGLFVHFLEHVPSGFYPWVNQKWNEIYSTTATDNNGWKWKEELYKYYPIDLASYDRHKFQGQAYPMVEAKHYRDEPNYIQGGCSDTAGGERVFHGEITCEGVSIDAELQDHRLVHAQAQNPLVMLADVAVQQAKDCLKTGKGKQEDIASHNEGVSHVPTSTNGYKDAALEHMKTNSYGIKYPSPSRPIDLGRSNDSLYEPDDKMASFILESTDATVSVELGCDIIPPSVRIVQLPENHTLEQLVFSAQICASHLANGFSVAVVPFHSALEFNWDPEHIRLLIGGMAGTLNQMVLCESQKERAKERQSRRDGRDYDNIRRYQTCSIQELMDRINGENDCIDCAYIPNGPNNTPPIVELLENDSAALKQTMSIGCDFPVYHLQHPSIIQQDGGMGNTFGAQQVHKDCTVAPDGTDALHSEPRGDVNEHLSKRGEIERQSYSCSDDSVTQGARKNIETTRNWMSITGSGFVSTNHINMGGWCTWSIVAVGQRLWAYVLPKQHLLDEERASNVYIDLFQALKQWESNGRDTFTELGHSQSISLHPGSIILQPPTKMNVVYTKTKSLTFGGRFLLRDGMHLTEFSSFLGNITKTPSNKCYSQYLYPSLCRMVLHIALSGPCEVLKKPFLSLARMVLFPHDYWDFECNKDAFLKNPSVVEPKSERDFHDYEESKHVLGIILAHNGVMLGRLNIIKVSVSTQSQIIGWTSGSELQWNIPGEEKIIIPKFSWATK